MALYTNTTMSIFTGNVDGNETSDTAGTLSKAVNDHILTLHTGSIISMETTISQTYVHGSPAGNKVVVSILNASGSGHTYNIADRLA
jgi:hypothetical protein|tara:strand:- start:374 stop:634 length:261 start_codon:yes stop_codon:yes gene_type:complete